MRFQKKTSSAFWFQPVWGLCACDSSFHLGGGGRGSASYKNNRNVSSLYLYLSGNWEFGDSVMWQNYKSLSVISFLAQQIFFVSYLPISQLLTLETAFCTSKTRTQGFVQVSEYKVRQRS